MKNFKLVIVILVLGCAALLPVSAEVTTLAIWRCGEDDLGAVDGGVAVSTTGIAGGGVLEMATNGASPVYSSSVTAPGSSYSLGRSGDDSFSSVSPVDLTDNVGMEVWVYPTSLDTFDFAISNGRVGNGGYGIVQTGGTWKIIHSGIVLGTDGAPVQLDAWQHLAFVREDGISTLYVNGVASGGTILAAPSVPDTFMLGANLVAAGFEGQFNGYIDHARLFSFNPGEFDISDFNYPVIGGAEPIRITEIRYDEGTGMISVTWSSEPGVSYGLFYSTDLTAFDADINDSIPAAADAETTTEVFAVPLEGAERLFFRVVQN